MSVRACRYPASGEETPCGRTGCEHHFPVLTATPEFPKSRDEVSVPLPFPFLPSHQHARSNRPAAATHRLASAARARRVDVAVAPVEVETAPFSVALVIFAVRRPVLGFLVGFSRERSGCFVGG